MPIYRIIAFTKTPLRKAFRYRDVFQLVPYTTDFKPEVSKYVVDYPCFLEYSLPDDHCDLKAQWDKDRELPVLLTAFSVYRVFIYDFHASSWGVNFPTFSIDYIAKETQKSYEEIRSETPEFNYAGFFYQDPKQILKENAFTEIAEENRMAVLKRYLSYIAIEQDRYDIRNDYAEINFSEETIRCLDAYFAMGEVQRKKIYSAARLISDCIAIKGYRHSLSFMAGVAALETMADMVTKENEQVVEDCPSCHAIASSPYKCQKCGRPIWGVTAKVKNFLKEYVSNNKADVKMYNRIYDLRSKITHTGDIFINDSIFDADDARTSKENLMEYKLLEYARRAMAGLLIGVNE